MSGNGDTNPAGAVSAIPFWFFHAADDGTVNVAGSDNLVAALRNAGGDVVYTRYDTGGHGIWPVAYTHPLLFAWIVSQQRGAPSTITPPSCASSRRPISPGGRPKTPTIDLAGSADHDDTMRSNRSRGIFSADPAARRAARRAGASPAFRSPTART